jgi:hypothetical protein
MIDTELNLLTIRQLQTSTKKVAPVKIPTQQIEKRKILRIKIATEPLAVTVPPARNNTLEKDRPSMKIHVVVKP